MCQARAIRSTEKVMAARSGDESNLINAAGWLALLAISQDATEMHEGNVYVYVSWESFFE